MSLEKSLILQLSNTRLSNLTTYVAVVVIGVLLVSLMIGHNTRQTELARRTDQRLVEQLQAAQDQLHDLAVAEERNRLAREIYDGLRHYLTARPFLHPLYNTQRLHIGV